MVYIDTVTLSSCGQDDQIMCWHSALRYLGCCYREGKGVEQNDALAVAWWKKAAEGGDAKSQYNLGLAYAAGVCGRGLHSSTFQLNLSRFWHKIHPKHPLIPPNTS